MSLLVFYSHNYKLLEFMPVFIQQLMYPLTIDGHPPYSQWSSLVMKYQAWVSYIKVVISATLLDVFFQTAKTWYQALVMLSAWKSESDLHYKLSTQTPSDWESWRCNLSLCQNVDHEEHPYTSKRAWLWLFTFISKGDLESQKTLSPSRMIG